MEERMRFTNYFRPPMQVGKYSINAKQKVTEPKNSEFQEKAEFYVSGNAYVMPKEDVFSVFPAENESGEFADILPFLVSYKRTFPWDRSTCSDQNDIPVPWVALIVLSSKEIKENVIEKDMTVSQLWGEKGSNVYFPDPSKRPAMVVEKEDDLCHVIELSTELYRAVMPSYKDLPYLCHGRSVNLKNTEDSVCARDGFFSVVCANRFIPSGEEEAVKSTVHLVSLLGYAKPGNPESETPSLEIPDHYDRVRLVSLYHWDVYSKKASEENFASVIARLKDNCGIMNYDRRSELQKKGWDAKKHITRTGEETYSLYRSPLLSFCNQEQLDIKEKHTADGRLLYDKDTGVFDVTYAAAWQLGRMITLNHPAIAKSILNVRKAQKEKYHHQLLAANLDFTGLPLEDLAVELVEGRVLEGKDRRTK